ncbi:MAG: hypothetical protein KFW09_00025 [Oscillospiraceae bacterium]|nr:hypothetical protein [Oscillospiraceae bacterium]
MKPKKTDLIYSIIFLIILLFICIYLILSNFTLDYIDIRDKNIVIYDDLRHKNIDKI